MMIQSKMRFDYITKRSHAPHMQQLHCNNLIKSHGNLGIFVDCKLIKDCKLINL